MSGEVLYPYSPDRGNDKPQFVVPMHEWQNILRESHDDPMVVHYRAKRTMERIARHYYWIGMSRHITDHVKRCIECQW